MLRDKGWKTAGKSKRKEIEQQAIFACIRAAGKSKQEEIVNEKLTEYLASLFTKAHALIEEDTPSLDKLVDAVRAGLREMRWQMIDEVDFYIVEIRKDYAIVGRYTETEYFFYKIPFTLNTATDQTEFGEWEQVVQVREYRTLDGETLEEVAQRLEAERRANVTVDDTGVAEDAPGGGQTTEFGRMLLLTVEDTPVVEETGEDEQGRKYLIYRGTALVDNVISGNGRFYSREANDLIMEATNAYMEEGGIVTVYSRHGKAVTGPLGELPTGLPVGKVVKPLWREGDRIRYEARISPTEEGQDVMVLLEDEVLKFSSIRSRPGHFKTVQKKVNGQRVDAVVEAVIHGIDLAEAPSIEGAEIDEILTEEIRIEDISIREEDDPMDWKTVTLEDLREQRPDLVEAVLAGQKLTEEVATLKADLVEATQKLKDAEEALAQAKTDHETALEALREEKDGEIAELTEEANARAVEAAIAQAVEGKEHAPYIRRFLTHGFTHVEEDKETWVPGATTVEEVQERLSQAEAAVKVLVEEFGKSPKDSFRGTLNTDEGDPPANGGEPTEGPLAEEDMAEVLRLSAG